MKLPSHLLTSTLSTGKTNFLLLILLILFSCPNNNSSAILTIPTTSATTLPSIDYDISQDFHISLVNTNILLEQKVNLGRQVSFYINPSLPSGLALNITNGNIKGTPATISLPTPYTVTAILDGKDYTIKIISLGVAPSRVWVTNTNSSKPYELTAYVVGDGTKQNGISWSSSDEPLATVNNNGVVNIKTSPVGGNVEITATKDGNTSKVAFNVPSTSIDYGTSNFYIARVNMPIDLVQNSRFSNTVFSANPALPNGLSLDTPSGSIRGTPTVVMLPSKYTIVAKVGSRGQTNIISLGIAPSQVWVTNTNSSKPYELTAYVVGDRTKQAGITWSSSDTSLATVNNNGVVNIKTPLIGGTVEIIATTTDGDTGKVTFNVPSTSIDYGTSNFYIARVNTPVDLVQNSKFSNTVFSANPALPNGLNLDTANGNIRGTPTVVMLPSEYTVTATVGGRSQTKIISIGVAPSQVWVTNTNSAKPYELTAFVVGGRTKQVGIGWSSSDMFLATVNNNGVVNIKTSPVGGDVIITATKDGNTDSVTFTVTKTPFPIDYAVNGDFYIFPANANVLLNQRTDFGGQARFSTSPNLPNGLSIDSIIGNINGRSTTSSLPTPYIVTAKINGNNYTNKVITLGVAPSQVWVTSTNSAKPYELTTFVVGDATKQTGVNWSSSDTSLATVNNNGMVSFLATTTGGTLEIIATTTDGNTGKATFNIDSVKDVNGGQIITEGGMTNLIINNGVTTITSAQFNGEDFNKVILPDGLTTIEKEAFAFKKLTRLVIPNSVTTIGDGAFYENQLTHVVIGNNVTNIGESAFAANQLNSLVIGNSLATIGRTVFYSNKLTSLVIPNNITTIGERAFGNNQLTSLVIPNSITTIGETAFYQNQLTRVLIPDSVTTIANFAFTENPNLVEVSLKQSLYTKITNTSSTNDVFGTKVNNYIKRP